MKNGPLALRDQNFYKKEKKKQRKKKCNDLVYIGSNKLITVG